MKDNCIVIFLLVTILLVCYLSSRENYEDPAESTWLTAEDASRDERVDIAISENNKTLGHWSQTFYSMKQGEYGSAGGGSLHSTIGIPYDRDGSGTQTPAMVGAFPGGHPGEGDWNRMIIKNMSDDYGFGANNGSSSDDQGQSFLNHGYWGDDLKVGCEGTGACVAYGQSAGGLWNKGGFNRSGASIKRIMRGGQTKAKLEGGFDGGSGKFNSATTDNGLLPADKIHWLAARTGKQTLLKSVIMISGASCVFYRMSDEDNAEVFTYNKGGSAMSILGAAGRKDRWDIYINPNGEFYITPKDVPDKVLYFDVNWKDLTKLRIMAKKGADPSNYMFAVSVGSQTAHDFYNSARDYDNVDEHKGKIMLVPANLPTRKIFPLIGCHDRDSTRISYATGKDAVGENIHFVNPESHKVVGGERTTAIPADSSPSYSILSQMGGAFGNVMTATSAEDCKALCTDDTQCNGFVSKGSTCALNTEYGGGLAKVAAELGSKYYMKSDKYSGFNAVFGTVKAASGQEVVSPVQSAAYCAGTCTTDPKCVAFSLSKQNQCTQLISDTPDVAIEQGTSTSDLKMTYIKASPDTPEGCADALAVEYKPSSYMSYDSFKTQCETGPCPRIPAAACGLEEYASITYDKKTDTKSSAESVGETMIISVDDCKIKCDAEETCAGFNYTEADGKCNMKAGFSDSTAITDTSKDFYLRVNK